MIFKFLENIKNDTKLYNYLKTVEAPPDKYIYDGTPPERVENIIFGLKEISGSGATRLKAIVTTLLTLI
ncbi:hypothetical protein IC006_2168 [Sulfuracidifex tepidarius]|uniref:Uncharacterized protein n=1 Tax=Sulfuracidifex tepidarius TaxID=1294262 RepID=A0A510DXA9_9CREN|nr:hypothetical protein IC006_2168 [Sulfuracidifex tepidarius]